jgi:hypothetical protein
LPSSNCRPSNAAIVFIDIFAVDSGGIIGIAVSIAIAIVIAIAFVVSAIAVVAVIVNAYHCCPIFIIQSPSSNCHPQIAAIIVIDIVSIGGGGGIIAVVFAVAITVAISSTIPVIAVIVDVALSTLLCHRCCRCSPWQPIGGSGPNHATEALPMACRWCPYP